MEYINISNTHQPECIVVISGRSPLQLRSPITKYSTFSLPRFEMRKDINISVWWPIYQVTTTTGFDLDLRISKQSFSRTSICRSFQTKKFFEFFFLFIFFNIKTYPSPAIRDCVTRNYILSSSMWVVELMKLREASFRPRWRGKLLVKCTPL